MLNEISAATIENYQKML